MASNINANNIDGTFPIAGQDNDSQGFRDNFTNTKTNFNNAKTEIEDLQSKVVLKSALTGTSLSNAGAGALMSDFELRDMSETRVSKGTTSGTVTLAYTEGSYVTVTTSGSVSLAFSSFPASGKLGRIRLEIDVQSVAHTLTLPSVVSIGLASLMGINSNTRVITFDEVGTYIFEFTTDDQGTTVAISDLTRNRSMMEQRTPVNIGQSGDKAGLMVVDTGYVYVCTGSYDGSTVIWKRVAVSAYQEQIMDYKKLQEKIDAIWKDEQATVAEATQGPGVDAVMELIDMGVSKEDLFDQMMRDHSDDELLAFADDYRRMNDFPGMED